MAVHSIRKGVDLPLAGAPAQHIEAATVQRVALLGADAIGLKPALKVEPGDRVLRGQVLYEDRATPGVRYTAPASGTVHTVHRGERRAFVSATIDVDANDNGETQIAFAQRDLRALLLESGLWTAFRTRPFSRVPPADGTPHAIFVTAIDTHPHAPDVDVVLAGRESDFAAGLRAIEQLAPGPVYLCKRTGSKVSASETSRCEEHAFAGPHPAGTPGLHIHLLQPVGLNKTVWHIGYQDVAAIGTLVTTGTLDVERVVSLAGPSVKRPRLLRTRLGASLDELTLGELYAGEQRVVSGSVLDGRAAMGEAAAYLGRYHQQIAVLPEGRKRELFGWIAPGLAKFSIWPVAAGHFARRGLPLSTTTNGGARAMVPIGGYERVMPLDLMPTFLLRALITGDAERAEALGCLELDEEDLALCTFVCPGKTEYGPLLRSMLTRLEKELA